MPATANTLAKAAHGIADNLLTATILAANCPVVFAPSMNATMWCKSTTQRNVTQLRADGHTVIEPVSGTAVSDGEEGPGGLPDIGTILRNVEEVLSARASERLKPATTLKDTRTSRRSEP